MSEAKVEAARARIRLAYDALQQRAPGEKLYVAYSGGKDSECIAELCISEVGAAGVEINYNATGIDPPEVVKHIKQRFAAWEAQGIECHFHKPIANMHDLIVAKGPPTRVRRYCCEKLKEYGGTGRVTVTGVRWAESPRRRELHGVLTVFSKRKDKRERYNTDNDIMRRVTEQCVAKDRLTINPIVDWADTDVWQFIRGTGIPYCSLYNEGFHRLGCIGCPMASKGRYKEFARWPHMKRYYLRAFTDYLSARPDSARANNWHTAEDVWHWWMEDGHVRGQMEMELEDE